MHTSRPNASAWVAPLAALIVSGGAVAQQTSTGLEEVIVTAQKRQERLQDIPIAISALSGETLTKLGALSIDQVAAATPTLTAVPYPTNSSALFIFIRGQGLGDPGEITQDGSVGLYVDGFYIARAMVSTFDLGDVDRVEVLRGPQGTLYGRNTTGGAVNIITQKPSGEFNLKQEVSFGNYNEFRSLTTVDLPEWYGLSAKVSFLDSQRDGYVKNINAASNDFDSSSERGGRAALHWAGPNGLSADYSYERANMESTPLYYVNKLNVGLIPGFSTNPFQTYRPFSLPESPSTYTQNLLTLTWEVSDALTVKSLSGWRGLSDSIYQDFAEGFYFAPASPSPAGAIPLGLQIADEIHDKQFSEELQFIGSVLDNQLKYAAGLYYFTESGTHSEWEAVEFPGPPAPGPIDIYANPARFVRADEKSRAVYGQLTWTPPVLNNGLDLTVGGRYTKDDRSASIVDPSNGVITPEYGSASFSKFNPAGTVSYRWSDELMTYARVATGYRSGGFVESYYNFSQGFGPENVKSYELGAKSDLLDRRLRINVALFRTDYTNIQLSITPLSNNVSVTQVLNVGKAYINGGEVEITYNPVEGLTLTGSYANLDPHVTYVDAAVSPFLIAEYPNGNAARTFGLSFVPRNNYTLGADYDFPRFADGVLSVHLDVEHHDRIFYTATIGPAVPGAELYSTPSNTLANARLAYDQELPHGGKLRISPWVKNLTNKQWIAGVNADGDIRGFYAAEYANGYPRMFGVDLVYQYK